MTDLINIRSCKWNVSPAYSRCAGMKKWGNLCLLFVASIWIETVTAAAYENHREGPPLSRNDHLPHLEPDFLSDVSVTTPSVVTMASLNYSVENVTPGHIDSSCKAFIDAFADAVAKYTKCMISYARPLRFCTHCVEHYVVAKAQYTVLMEVMYFILYKLKKKFVAQQKLYGMFSNVCVSGESTWNILIL